MLPDMQTAFEHTPIRLRRLLGDAADHPLFVGTYRRHQVHETRSGHSAWGPNGNRRVSLLHYLNDEGSKS
jgi:hypothetical protein